MIGQHSRLQHTMTSPNPLSYCSGSYCTQIRSPPSYGNQASTSRRPYAPKPFEFVGSLIVCSTQAYRIGNLTLPHSSQAAETDNEREEDCGQPNLAKRENFRQAERDVVESEILTLPPDATSKNSPCSIQLFASFSIELNSAGSKIGKIKSSSTELMSSCDPIAY